MARGVNKAILIGNVGQDPEVKVLPSGASVANFTLATTETWVDKQSGQRQERVEWHRCNAFGKLAEIIQQFVKKGSKLYLEGSIHTRKWTDQSGADRYSTEIKVRDMQMLDSGGGQQQGGNAPQGGYPQGNPQQGYQQPPPQGYQKPPQGNPQGQVPQGYQQPPVQPQQNYQQPPPPQGQQPQQNYVAPDPGAYDDFDSEIPF